MSASLVGSEMCIRDSGRSPVRGGRQPLGQGERARDRLPLGHPGGVPPGVAQDNLRVFGRVDRGALRDVRRGRPRHDPREEAPGDPPGSCRRRPPRLH
eukprot:1540916-Alexandrium_andersonii.AAC.1